MLSVLREAVDELLQEKRKLPDTADRIRLFQQQNRHTEFTRKDYLKIFPQLSSATASRDLQWAASEGILHKKGDKRKARYLFR